MRTMTCLMLVLLASPTFAACPPPGQDLASLRVLKANNFAIADAAEKQALAAGLVDCLASPDPELRDGIAFDALSTWMRAGDFDAAQLRVLRDALSRQLHAPDPDGVLHPFAVLVLSEVARTDRVAPWMGSDERAAMLGQATAYLVGEHDYRGFEPGIGWRHGIAHGADWLLQLVLNPALDHAQLQQVIDAVALQALSQAGHAYVFGEPARLARPLVHVARRDVLADADWQEWLDDLLAQLGPMPNDGERGDADWLARQHNLKALLGHMHFQADQARDLALARLKPLLAKALAAIP